MIELNLLEKKEPLRLPIVLGVDFNELNLIMLVVAMLFWFIPQAIYDSYNENRVAEDAKSLADLKDKAEVLKKEIGKNSQIKEMLKAYQDQVEKLKVRSTQVDEILKVRTNPKKVLEKLARSIPEDLWFEKLNITAAGDMQISGGSYSSRSLGEFITIINDSPYFAGSVTPIKQENKQDNIDGASANIDVFELKGKIKSFDMRVK